MKKKKIRFKFLKERYYMQKLYKPGDIVEMSPQQANIYINFKAGEIIKGEPKILKDKEYFESFEYKEIQNMCKRNNIIAVGKKDELIESLIKAGV